MSKASYMLYTRVARKILVVYNSPQVQLGLGLGLHHHGLWLVKGNTLYERIFFLNHVAPFLLGVPLVVANGNIICDTYIVVSYPVVPVSFPKAVFD